VDEPRVVGVIVWVGLVSFSVGICVGRLLAPFRVAEPVQVEVIEPHRFGLEFPDGETMLRIDQACGDVWLWDLDRRRWVPIREAALPAKATSGSSNE
jgi:hypothetical protein